MRGRIWRASAVIFAGLIAGACIAEIGLRVLGMSWPSLYQWDEHVGNRLRPNITMRWTLEGNGLVETNSRGLRDEEHQIPKPEEVWRFAVLGDSMAEALQVDSDETFWAHIEDELAGCPPLKGKTIESVNFGVSGHGTGQAVQTLRHFVWDYDPDAVVLTLTNGNDVRNNSKQLESEMIRPFFLENGDSINLDKSFEELIPKGYKQTTINFLNTFRLGQLALELKRIQARGSAIQNGGESTELGTEYGLDYLAFAPPKSRAWAEAWSITERLLLTASEETTQQGAIFLGVMIPSGFQVNLDSDFRRTLASDLGVSKLDYPEARISAFAHREQLPFLFLAENFLTYARSSGTELHGFDNLLLGGGHLNQAGHRLMGQLTAEALCHQASKAQGQ